MSKREYPGYPLVVIPALVKCGNQTLNKCFEILGYKVCGMAQIPSLSQAMADYGTGKINFPEMAKIAWEDNEYDVIIEPSGLYFKEMAEHWPKTKFINLVRDPIEFKQSLEVLQCRLSENFHFM